MHEIKFFQKFQLFIVRQIIRKLNLVFIIFGNFLFDSLPEKPGNILIYKIGNIGDIICAIPSFYCYPSGLSRSENHFIDFTGGN